MNTLFFLQMLFIVCVHARVRVGVRACVRACVRECVRVCMRACVCVYHWPFPLLYSYNLL